MKLIKFKAPSGVRGKYLRVNTSGSSAFSKDLVEEMNLKNGDAINFYQDEDRPTDWYMSKCEPEDGGSVVRFYESKSKGATNTNYLFNNSKFGKELARQFDQQKKSFRVMVGAATDIDGVIYYPLITASLKASSI